MINFNLCDSYFQYFFTINDNNDYRPIPTINKASRIYTYISLSVQMSSFNKQECSSSDAQQSKSQTNSTEHSWTRDALSEVRLCERQTK